MRRAYRHLVLFALVSMFVGLGMTASQTERNVAQAADPQCNTQCNIIFILTDDMRYDDLELMTQTESRLVNEVVDQGVSFDNAYVSTPLCCPSRATIMRGQYAHNTDVWFNTNVYSDTGRDGGWEGYQRNGYEDDNIATHLHAAGYRTGFFGKYLNGYSGTSKPPGWDDWFAFLQDKYYNYDVNDNGTTTHFGTSESDYSTDVLTQQTLQFIADSAGQPFFAYVAPRAPHLPATPAPRHLNAFNNEQAPQSASFDEADVSRKPPWIQSLRRLTSDDIADINDIYERRHESLLSVDEMVEKLVSALRDTGKLDNTYIVFTSDNGWYRGEHRIRKGKGRPYEEAPHVPLVISGPGVPAGKTTDELVLNTDYFPTFMDVAGAPPPSYVDGRSLLPVLENPDTTSLGRTAILIEGRKHSADPEIPVDRNYNGIREITSTSDSEINRKYVEYEGGFLEYYNLSNDPYEIQNSYDDPDTGPTDSEKVQLHERLLALKDCAADTCRTAENGP